MASISADELGEAEEVASDRSPNKIFVGNLDPEVRPGKIRAVFESVGPVQWVSAPRDIHRGWLTRGYAFVEMKSPEDAKRAKAELHGTRLGDRVMLLDWARS